MMKAVLRTGNTNLQAENQSKGLHIPTVSSLVNVVQNISGRHNNCRLIHQESADITPREARLACAQVT